MSISPNGAYHEYSFTSISGTIYRKKLSEGVATGGGWTQTIDLDLPDWGNATSKNKLPGVYGKNITGGVVRRAFLPCPSNDAAYAIFSTGTFDIGDLSYNATGMRGEHRSNT